MKITIRPEKRNRDNVTILCEKSSPGRSASTTDDGIAISFSTDVRTSGSFYGTLYLSVSELYELIGVAAQHHFENVQQHRRAISAAERKILSIERKQTP
ncbi:hypothetical protein [Paracoccus sp. (in: a-proteobacteria)]|uniref:hypothetical protein n=1 Tax=Paracoccus sp. TaxID=267 RepID=UPI0026DFEE1E|nr:hypothetical protein [Paracoccus sp. (in: a-proteobacteria)]MDO5368994.1 hypothetical protein [Paracoccus sp. (in: a-proteobacteria)]